MSPPCSQQCRAECRSSGAGGPAWPGVAFTAARIADTVAAITGTLASALVADLAVAVAGVTNIVAEHPVVLAGESTLAVS